MFKTHWMVRGLFAEKCYAVKKYCFGVFAVQIKKKKHTYNMSRLGEPDLFSSLPPPHL